MIHFAADKSNEASLGGIVLSIRCDVYGWHLANSRSLKLDMRMIGYVQLPTECFIPEGLTFDLGWLRSMILGAAL